MLKVLISYPFSCFHSSISPISAWIFLIPYYLALPSILFVSFIADLLLTFRRIPIPGTISYLKALFLLI